MGKLLGFHTNHSKYPFALCLDRSPRIAEVADAIAHLFVGHMFMKLDGE